MWNMLHGVIAVALVSFLLTLNIFHTWSNVSIVNYNYGKCRLGNAMNISLSEFYCHINKYHFKSLYKIRLKFVIFSL